MRKSKKILATTTAILSIAGIAGTLMANAETTYNDSIGRIYSGYDINKDGEVNVFDIVAMKRFLVNDAPEIPSYEIKNYQISNDIMLSVRDFISSKAPDWYSRITDIELDTPSFDDGHIAADLCIATVTFDRALSEEACYHLIKNYYDEDIDECISFATENNCKTIRITVNASGNVKACVPVVNEDLSISTNITSDNKYIMIASDYLLYENANWYARVSSIDVDYSEQSKYGAITITFDQNLTEEAIYTLIKSDSDDINETINKFVANPTKTMRMIISYDGSVESCVPVYSTKQTTSVNTTTLDTSNYASVIEYYTNEFLATNHPSWFAKVKSIDVQTWEDNVAKVKVVFDRPLDERAVHSMYKGNGDVNDIIDFAIQNKTNTLSMVFSGRDLIACEPIVN